MDDPMEFKTEILVSVLLDCGHGLSDGIFGAGGIEDISKLLKLAHKELPDRLRARAAHHQCHLVTENNPYGQPRLN